MNDCNEWRTEKRHECANMGKVKRLELRWQLYRTSLPVRDLENFRPMNFCWHECTTSCNIKTLYILFHMGQGGGGLFPYTALTDWLLGVFAKLRLATISFVMSVRPSAWNNSAPTRRIFMTFDIWSIFRKSVEKIKVSLKSDKNNRQFTWRTIHIFYQISLNSS